MTFRRRSTLAVLASLSMLVPPAQAQDVSNVYVVIYVEVKPAIGYVEEARCIAEMHRWHRIICANDPTAGPFLLCFGSTSFGAISWYGLASRADVMALVTFNFWPEHRDKAETVWSGILETLRLAEGQRFKTRN